MSPTATALSHVHRLGRAVLWAVVTGRDRDLGPPLVWWHGRAWLRWSLLGAFVVFWAGASFRAWNHALAGDQLLAGVLIVLQLLPSLLSRSRPLTAVRIALLGTAAVMVVLYTYPVPQPLPGPSALSPRWPLDSYFVPYVPVLVLALARSRPLDWFGLTVTVSGLIVVNGLVRWPRVGAQAMVWPLGAVAVLTVIGYLLHHERQAADAAIRTAFEEREGRAALQERTRIARELHDVIGHHLSMIAVRADSAPYRLPQVDDNTRQELAAIGAAARQALQETRLLLGVLGHEDSRPDHTPQPTLTDIPHLIQQSKESGMNIQLDIDGQQPEAPAAVELAAYRTVQEALSNARRHSTGAPVHVHISYEPKEIRLIVDNEATPAANRAPEPRGGTGLMGIRERVAIVDGSCHAGPRADGGFRVSATLPIAAQEGPDRSVATNSPGAPQ